MDVKQVKKDLCSWIDENKQEFSDLARYVWEQAELSMEEKNSSAAHIEVLSKYGFEIEKGVSGVPYAYIATYENGGPVIGINAEYDALPGLSQDTCCTKKPIKQDGPGHGCGHNLLGAGGVNAAVALKVIAEKYGINVTIKVFGAAAEEICIGKPFMARDGYFEGVDVFFDWHPWSYNRADYDTCNAYFNIKYHFKGKACHGNSPWYGRSAFDAAMLQGHAVEMLREHIRPSMCGLDAANTINYTFSDTGPEIPSVVADRTTAWYIGRFDRAELMVDVIDRINKCAEGAALATGTTVEIETVTACHDKLENVVLSEVMHKNMEEIGVPKFTEEEHQYAKNLQKAIGLNPIGLDETIMPFGGGGTALCDTSEYSWFAPYATIWVTAGPSGTGWHNWTTVACTGTEIGFKAVNCAAKIMAASALDVLADPSLIDKAKAELKERMSERQYIKLLPDDAKPPVGINAENMAKFR
ncbi:MAG: amidohydrolase [Bacillota bacterium]|nr:amidohydrolase [Bacillota bacterium]